MPLKTEADAVSSQHGYHVAVMRHCIALPLHDIYAAPSTMTAAAFSATHATITMLPAQNTRPRKRRAARFLRLSRRDDAAPTTAAAQLPPSPRKHPTAHDIASFLNGGHRRHASPCAEHAAITKYASRRQRARATNNKDRRRAETEEQRRFVGAGIDSDYAAPAARER